MNTLEKNVAVLRGEAMAASLLASAALQLSLSMLPNRNDAVAGLYAWMDDSLNQSRPGVGDADDEFNTQMRETARFMAMQHLDGIKQSLDRLPR